MSDFLDTARAVRDGEALDAHSLFPYLREQLGKPDAVIELEQFPGGHSNLTYLVRIDGEDFVLRRPPFGSKVKTAHDMSREYRMLSKLAPHYPRAPAPLLMCEDESVLGCQFYVMKRLHGVILRKTLPKGLTLPPETARALCQTMADTFAELHGLDYEAMGLGDFGKPVGYVERQVTGWTKRYYASKTDEVPHVDDVTKWLADNMPGDAGAGIIHNDYKFDNLVLDPEDLTRIIGILDWEMTTIGDPLMDVGSSLAYWVQDSDPDPVKGIGFGPTLQPGMFTRREFADRYAEASGRDLSNIVFYFAFGLFKTAVILQQIYYRYRHGLTTDQRFAAFGMAVALLVNRAAHAIDTGAL